MSDDRIWRPDLLAVLDWGTVFEAGKQGSGDATWWIQATAGVNYYRAEMPAKHLPGRTVFFDVTDIQQVGEEYVFPRQDGNTAIWMFPGNVTRWIAMAEMHTQGKRVLVEVDDNYLVGPPIGSQTWLTTRDKTGQDRYSYEAHAKIVASDCTHGIVVSTPYLGRVYEKFGKPVYVCPNSVDPDDWPDDPPHQPDGILRIGWAGSASHKYDLADIRPALDWASRQKDVEVVVMGELDPGVPHRRIEWTTDLSEYRRNVSEIDVMLCPIRANEWANCKSDVKALEASMGNACSIVSRTEPFRDWWDGEAPGYVAETKKDYVKAVKHLIANRDEARETARLAREYALTKRNIAQSVETWRAAVSAS